MARSHIPSSSLRTTPAGAGSPVATVLIPRGVHSYVCKYLVSGNKMSSSTPYTPTAGPGSPVATVLIPRGVHS